MLRDFAAGATAGFAVDVALLPIDTIKTRLQSRQGFSAAGGLKNIYAGLAPAAACSVPSGAFFFTAYEETKRLTGSWMLASVVGEAAACLVRVPCDTIKQRLQAGYAKSVREAFNAVRERQGVWGLYAAYTVTLSRELPFAAIQFGLLERCKVAFGDELWKCAVYGSLCGAVAGAVTTPLDVAKTRVMLDEASRGHSMMAVLQRIAREEGPHKLFSGLTARVGFLSVGGFVFVGTFEAARTALP
jgi:solute carrier family 25 S-adenosylmethionine transporter 26